jgi:hypothetical protein
MAERLVHRHGLLVISKMEGAVTDPHFRFHVSFTSSKLKIKIIRISYHYHHPVRYLRKLVQMVTGRHSVQIFVGALDTLTGGFLHSPWRQIPGEYLKIRYNSISIPIHYSLIDCHLTLHSLRYLQCC